MLNTARTAILLLLSLAFGTMYAGAGRGGVQYSEERPLVYEDSWNLWPYVFINQDGKPDGINIDVLREVFECLKIPYKVRLRPSHEAREDLRCNRADLSIGMRKDYNAPFGRFGKSTIAVFTHSILAPARDSLTHVTQEDLYRLRFAVHEGSLSHHYLSHHGYDYAMQPTEDMEDLTRDMAMRDSGIVVWNTMSLKYLRRKYNLDNFTLAPVDIPEGEYRFMSNDERLLQRLDSTIDAMRSDGRLDAIITKWFYPEEEEGEMPTEWMVAGYTVMVLFIVIAVVGVLMYMRYRRSRRMLDDMVSRLNLVLHSNAIKVWIYNPATRKYSWLGRKGEMGREYSSFEFSLFYPRDEFEKINDRVTSFLSQESDSLIMSIKAYSLKNSNKVLDIELRMGSIKDEYRHVVYVVGIQHDISEYKSKVERRREMTYYSKSLFRSSMMGLYKFDAGGSLIDLNLEAMRMMGVENVGDATAKGVTLQSAGIFPGELPVQAGVRETSLTIDFGDPACRFPFAGAGVLTPPAVRHFKASLMTFVSDDSEVTCHLLFLADVTDRKEREDDVERKRRENDRLERETEHARHLLDFIFRTGGTRMMVYDTERRILTTSRIKKAESIPMTQIDVLDLADPQSLPELFRVFRLMDAGADEDVNAVYRSFTHYSREEYRTLHMQMQPMHRAEGKVKTYVGTITDLTDIVKSQKVLEEETARAKETDHLKQNFINNMSYRVRIPLVNISGNIGELARGGDRDTERRELEKVGGNITWLLSLLDDTLLLSRLEAGLTEIYRSQCEFNAVFAKAFDDGVGRYRRDGVEYVVERDSINHLLNLDPNLVQRVIRETVAFLARYTVSGIIRARYMYRRDSVTVIIESSDYVMDEMQLPGLFQPRISDGMPASSDSSSGLEMAIVKAVIDLLGGRIDVESKIGLGSSVLIDIPVEE